MSTTSPLPPLYATWISTLLGGPLPEETRATCDRCAMCNDVAPDASAFNPSTKCCTYMPILPNFLVGLSLGSADPEGEAGRETVRARIASGGAVTPLGLGVPARFGLLYEHGGTRSFGQSAALRCPHYLEDGGRCGVWQQRNGVCATWFCKHVRGELGFRFWQSVRELLSAIEKDLARWCLVEIGVGAKAIAHILPVSHVPGVDASALTVADLDGRVDPVAHRASWGAWIGRETELYRACADRVSSLDAAAVLRICGPEVQLRLDVTRAVYAELAAPEPPARLRSGTLVLLRGSRAKQRVCSYSTLDPVEMPRTLFDALPTFDGRPTEDARLAIAAEGGPRLSKGLVRKLVDFGVLVAVDEVAPTVQNEPTAG